LTNCKADVESRLNGDHLGNVESWAGCGAL
jgi:hypothetical protein